MVVAERGQAIALLQPIRSTREVASPDAKLAQLAARGTLTRRNALGEEVVFAAADMQLLRAATAERLRPPDVEHTSAS